MSAVAPEASRVFGSVPDRSARSTTWVSPGRTCPSRTGVALGPCHGDGLASASQFNLRAGFGFVNDPGKPGSGFGDRIPLRHGAYLVLAVVAGAALSAWAVVARTADPPRPVIVSMIDQPGQVRIESFIERTSSHFRESKPLLEPS
jgi:hypothetical protein